MQPLVLQLDKQYMVLSGKFKSILNIFTLQSASLELFMLLLKNKSLWGNDLYYA